MLNVALSKDLHTILSLYFIYRWSSIFRASIHIYHLLSSISSSRFKGKKSPSKNRILNLTWKIPKPSQCFLWEISPRWLSQIWSFLPIWTVVWKQLLLGDADQVLRLLQRLSGVQLVEEWKLLLSLPLMSNFISLTKWINRSVYLDWECGSMGKSIAVKNWGLEFEAPVPTKCWVGVDTYLSS